MEEKGNMRERRTHWEEARQPADSRGDSSEARYPGKKNGAEPHGIRQTRRSRLSYKSQQ